MDYSIEQVTAAYERIGIYPLPEDAFTFCVQVTGDLIFHAPFSGSLSVEFLLEDTADVDPDLAEKLYETLGELFG